MSGAMQVSFDLVRKAFNAVDSGENSNLGEALATNDYKTMDHANEYDKLVCYFWRHHRPDTPQP